VKEHAIFVLSQRDESEATDALMRIVRDDPDAAMRKRALFWLGQKDDPRVASFIKSRILEP
jgi:HEAT repeat protein